MGDGRIKTTNDIHSEAIKRYHEQMLDNAKEAIRKIDVNSREYTSSTFTMRSSNIPKAKELVREFREKFTKLLEEENGDGTFHIQVQFFPLTKLEVRNEKAN